VSRPSDDALRVVRVEHHTCVLLTPDGPQTHATLLRVAVGDWALLDKHGQVDQIVPRTTAVSRLSAGGQAVEQVLAANIDVVAVCAPLELDTRPARIERLLALAWSSGAQPILVATKLDLCPAEEVVPALEQFAGLAPGVEVIAVAVENPDTFEPIRQAVAPDRTLVMVGASGVGKSSLINALLGHADLATREIRADGKGRHTTAWRELVEIPGGGYLIDTPGLRSVGLSGDDEGGVDAVFTEIAELAELCRFTDCSHDTEPGCAVIEAIEDGRLDPGRLERHRKLQRELAYQKRRFDARARAEHTRQWLARVTGNRKARP